MHGDDQVEKPVVHVSSAPTKYAGLHPVHCSCSFCEKVATRRRSGCPICRPNISLVMYLFNYTNLTVPQLTLYSWLNNKLSLSNLGRARRSHTTRPMQQSPHWFHPQNSPFPFLDYHPHLVHPLLDRPHSPPQTAARST